MEGLGGPGAAEGPDSAGGACRAAPLSARLTPPTAEAGSVRLQFEGGRRLGRCVAWDRASGLLAAELQYGGSPNAGGGEAASGGRVAAAAIAIVDPQAPESHFVAHVPAGTRGTAGEGLAALLWSPPCCRRMLLAVTASGAAYSWTMEHPAAAAAPPTLAAAEAGRRDTSGSGGGNGADGSRGRCRSQPPVACVNQWYGRLAFQLPLGSEMAAGAGEAPTLIPAQPPATAAAATTTGAETATATATATAGPPVSQADHQQQQAHHRQQQRLLCCRFLEPTSAAAAWDVGAAPPFADRPLPTAQVVAHYRQLGLEKAFVAAPSLLGSVAAPSSPGAAAAAAATAEGGAAHSLPATAAAAPGWLEEAAPGSAGGAPSPAVQPPLLPPQHWLRPGLLCLAAVTDGGQLLLACWGRGAGSQVESSSGSCSGFRSTAGASSWVLAPPVQLPLQLPLQQTVLHVVPLKGESCGCQLERRLGHADVAPAANGSLLVAAAPAAASSATAAASAANGAAPSTQQQQQQPLMLFEVAGVPPLLAAAVGGSTQQQQQAVQLTILPSSFPLGSNTLCLAFLPPAGGTHNSSAGGVTNRLLVAVSSAGGGSSSSGTAACLLTCASGGSGGGSSVRSAGGMHCWGVQAGPAQSLSADPLPPGGVVTCAAAVPALPLSGNSLALLLPASHQLLWLEAGTTNGGSSGAGGAAGGGNLATCDNDGSWQGASSLTSSGGCRLVLSRPPAPTPLPFLPQPQGAASCQLPAPSAQSAAAPSACPAAGAAAGATQSLAPPPLAATANAVALPCPAVLALSPNGLFAAVGAVGGSGLLLLPLLQQPELADEVEAFMLRLGKACCTSLLAGTGHGSCCWDLAAAAGAACRRWGHQGLQLTQQLVDGAVHAVRDEARPHYAAAWGRLKAALLAAAAAAHPAAAADHTALAVRADAAAREWMAAAADILDQHLPDKVVRMAAAASKPAFTPETKATLLRLLPARFWALWAADFSCYLTRCLLHWLKLKKEGPQQQQQQLPPTDGQPPVDGVTALPAWPQIAAGTNQTELTPPFGKGAGAAVEAAAAAAREAAEAFTAEQNGTTDCLPCIRLLSDAQFYRAFSRLVAAIHQFSTLLGAVQPSNSKGSSSMQLLVQQLQVVQDMVVLLRALHEAYTKAQANGDGSGGGGGGSGDAATPGGLEVPSRSPDVPAVAALPAGYAGAWTLVCGQPSLLVSHHQVASALQKLSQQQGSGSSLLERVRQHIRRQPEGSKGDSLEGLLEAAGQLGLLPQHPQTKWGSSGSGGGGGGVGAVGDGAAGGGSPLLLQRQVALAAAEGGEKLDGSLMLAPLPAVPSLPLAWFSAEPENFPDNGSPAAIWGVGWRPSQQQQQGGLQQQAPHHQQQQQQEEQRQHKRRRLQRQQRRQQAVWERERDAALGLPPPPPAADDPAAFEGSLDVLTARPLSWEYGVTYATTDGSWLTAELQAESFAPGSALAWQAAYVAGPPVGGQRWKRVRTE